MNRTDLMEFVNLKFPYKLLALHGAQGPTVGNVQAQLKGLSKSKVAPTPRFTLIEHAFADE